MNDSIPELIFDDPGLRGPKGENGDAPSQNVAKVAPYLYHIDYKDWDYIYAALYADELASWQGGCSAIVNGDLIGHNLDDDYDERAEFVLSMIASKGRHASVGLASAPSYLLAQYVDAGVKNDDTEKGYNVLPFMTMDGINDAGVIAVMNSVPMDYGRTTGTNPDCDDMPEFCLVRYILDYAGSVQEAIDLVDNVNVYSPDSVAVKNEFYLIVADATRCVRIEFINNVMLCTELDKNIGTIGTNFLLHDYDGTVESLQPHANGVERYNILSAGFESSSTKAGMIELLKSVRYTKKYNEEEDPFWFSDYRKDWTEYGWKDLTKDSPEEDYLSPVEYSIDMYNMRKRNGITMQTVHTSVYDMNMKSLTVLSQESDQEHNFCLDLMPYIEAETERAVGEENDIRDELHQGYYTKDDVNDLVYQTEQQIIDNVADNYYSKEEIGSIVLNIGEAITHEHEVITEEVDQKLAEKMNVPENDGSDGQMLYKTETGHVWGNAPRALPDVTAEDNDKIMAVEDGRWVLSDKFADYIRYINLIVNITSDNGGVCHGGLMITVMNADTHDVINMAEFRGQPVTFRVPRGLHYRIEQTGIWEGYHNPTPEYIEGAATVDANLVFTYEAIKIPETLRELEILVESGSAASLASHIGLQFADTYDDNGISYDIIWDLKHVKQVIGEDGESHTGVFLEWHNTTPNSLPFDAPERLAVDRSTTPVAEAGLYYYGLTGNTYKLLNLSTGEAIPYDDYDSIYVNAIRSTDASVIKRGYSRYSDSAVRKWLNSDADPGQWFTPSHVGDVPPTQAAEIAGFKKGCSEQILRMAKPVVFETAEAAYTNYELCDTFFIPSVTEVYGIHDNVEEGVAWQDWIEATGFSLPSNDSCAGRKIYAPGTVSAQEVGLRTANVGYQYIVWDIKPNGSIDGYTNASATRKYTPCCVIYK